MMPGYLRMKMQELGILKNVLRHDAREVITNPCWINVEKELRRSITLLYRSLAQVKGERELRDLQASITARVEFFNDLYAMAGYRWAWKGYSDIAEAEEEDENEMVRSEYEAIQRQRAMDASTGG